uniref:Uncharacterized protein n=1 Tax=viral metagenome TaxID=1070528 RepID=A0A6M3KHH7_9ZZZZ
MTKTATYCPFCKGELIRKSTMSSYCPECGVVIYISIEYTAPDSKVLLEVLERE